MADKISTSYQMIGASAEEGKTKMRGDRGGDGGREATDKREWKKGKKNEEIHCNICSQPSSSYSWRFVTVSLEESEDRLPSKHRFQEKFPKNSNRKCQ